MTDIKERFKERFKALDMELDAKAAARREQTVQVERKNVEKQAELQNEVVKTADIEKEKGNQTLTVEAVTSKPELDYRRQKTEQTHEVREQAEISAELRARFDVAGQEPDVAKLAVQLPVQDVSEPALNCVERIQQQDEQHEGEASEQAVHAGSMPEEATELGYLERQQPVLDGVGRDQQHRQSEKVFEREKLKDNDPEQQAQWKKMPAQRMHALGRAGAEEAREAAELAGQKAQQQAERHRNDKLAANSRQGRWIASTFILRHRRSCKCKRSEYRTQRVNCTSSWQIPSPRSGRGQSSNSCCSRRRNYEVMS